MSTPDANVSIYKSKRWKIGFMLSLFVIVLGGFSISFAVASSFIIKENAEMIWKTAIRACFIASTATVFLGAFKKIKLNRLIVSCLAMSIALSFVLSCCDFRYFLMYGFYWIVPYAIFWCVLLIASVLYQIVKDNRSDQPPKP